MLAAGVCILAMTHVVARAEQPHATDLKPPTTLAEAIDRAERFVGESYLSAEPGPLLAQCAAVLEPWRDVAWANFEPHMPYPWLLARCRYGARSAAGHPVTEQEVRQTIEPWIARRRAMLPNSAPDAAGVASGYSRLLYAVGLGPQGTAHLLAETARHIEAIDDSAQGAFHLAVVHAIARGSYGSWQFQDEVRELQALFERRLGANHLASLLTLRALAYHERFLGRPRQALEYIERAVLLTRQRQPPDPVLGAHMAAEYAACLASAGRPADAHQQTLAAREVFAAQTPTPHANLTRINYNLAAFALDMGNYPLAVDYATRSIEHATRSNEPVMLVEALVPRATRELARLYQGQADAAPRLREVLAETNHNEMHVGEHAVALVTHAVEAGDSEMLQWAGKFADAQIGRFSGPLQSDSALRPLIAAWSRAGHALRDDDVRGLLERAVAISLSGRRQGTLALTQFNLARHMATADVESAIWLYKRGANALQRLRAGLPSGEAELHRAWLSTHERDLRAFIGLLIDQGRLVEAEQALQLLRDEESFEYTRRAPLADAAPKELSFTPVEARRNHAMVEVEREAEGAAKAADKRLDGSNAGRLRDFYTDAQATKAIDQLTSAVHQIVEAPPTQWRGGVTPPLRTLAPPRGVARLTYLLRDDALDILVQIGTRLQRHTVAVTRGELNRAVQAARATLSNPQFDPQPGLQRLWRWLLEPIAPLIASAGIHELQVVPDAALRYVPFAALHDGKRYLAERFSIDARWAGSTHASAADRARAKEGRPNVTAFGRTAGDEAHDPLPGVAQELATLRAFGAAVHDDARFTAQQMRAALQQRPFIVHIASHFVLDPAGEERSYLLLGDGTRMTLGELSRLPWQGVRLAILSACDSGVSLDGGPGRELVGFASALRRAGVHNVLATLWRVADGATAQWTALFYEPLPRGGAGAVIKALRVAQAQRQWLRQHASTPLAHPHYWAAFTWLGGD